MASDRSITPFFPLPAGPFSRASVAAFVAACLALAAAAPAPAQGQPARRPSGASLIDVEVAPTTATATPSPAAEQSAEQAAGKLLPEAGTEIKSTEGSELVTQAAVVATPVKIIEDGKFVLANGETTETAAIKSGAALLGMLGQLKKPEVKPKAEREIEQDKATALFDQAEVRQMLGDSPTVVYQVTVEATPLPDPMIIPWVRKPIILSEQFADAVELMQNGKIVEGREMLERIAAEAPNSEYGEQSRQILAKLEELNSKPSMIKQIVTPVPTATPISIIVDPSVRISTVISDPASPKDNRVMIGGRGYKIGDTIRGFANHRIISITDETVVLDVTAAGQTRRIPVPVRQQPN